MIRKRLLRSSAILACTIASVASPDTARSQSELASISYGDMRTLRLDVGRYPWKRAIVTTTFWVGEEPTANNPMPNHFSAWDKNWRRNYGGTDHPSERANLLPAKFTPKQNPFYIALPYNDCTIEGYKPEAASVIPWFKDGPLAGSKRSVLKGRWVAIRSRHRVAYAQWEDAGPFRTDHWQYVFGNERPKPNLNKGAGLDISPAVRDFLGVGDTSVTDWRFVDFADVPPGPWSDHGDNNTFVQQKRGSANARNHLTVLAERYLPVIMDLGRGGLPLGSGGQ